MNSSIEIQQAVPPCSCRFVSLPLSDYRRKVFQECGSLFENLQGDILDFGCGIAGLYWALGYIHKVSTLSFLDRSPLALDDLRNQLSNTSPQMIEENFAPTLDELEASFSSKKSWQRDLLAEYIEQKSSLIIEEDFLRAETATRHKRQFDGIISIQALQCVNSYLELVSACTNIRLMLKDSGRLIGVTLRYSEATNRIKTLIQHGHEGSLNPNPMNLAGALDEAGFEVKMLKTVPVANLESHHQMIIFHAIPR